MKNKKKTFVVVIDLKKPIEYHVKASSPREAKKLAKEKLTCRALSNKLELEIYKTFYL